MKFFFILFIVLSFNSFAGKTYTYNLTIRSLFEHATLQGIQVNIKEKEGSTYHFTTNKEGKITAKLQKKEFSIEITDSTGNHRSYLTDNSFYKTTVLTEEIDLRLNEELERQLIESKMAPEGTELILDDLKIDCLENAQVANYIGGIQEMFKFIAKNIEFPQACIDHEIQGNVKLIFKISDTGEISDITIYHGLSPEADVEAIRIVSYMPNFQPAHCQGDAISSYYQLPIRFKLD